MLTIAAKKKHRGIKLNPVERVGMAVVYLICIMAGILTIVPFLYIVAGSFATEKELVERAFFIIPHTFSLNAYKYIIADGSIFRGLANSFFISRQYGIYHYSCISTVKKQFEGKKCGAKCNYSYHAVFRRYDSKLSGGKGIGTIR